VDTARGKRWVRESARARAATHQGVKQRWMRQGEGGEQWVTHAAKVLAQIREGGEEAQHAAEWRLKTSN